MLSTQIGDLRAFGRYARDLQGFVGRPLRAGEAEVLVAQALARREEAFLTMVGSGIYANPSSPYRRLLTWAGVAEGDVRAEVAAHGVERTLEGLYDAGVRLSAEELRGRAPVERAGLAPFTVTQDDLDNPLATGVATTTTSSSGVPRRARFELALLDHEAAHQDLALRAAGLERHRHALWRPVPPGIAGLNDVLRNGRLGRPFAAWFSQFPTGARPGYLRHAALVTATRALARRAGLAIPRPVHVPVDRAGIVAAWIAAQDAPVFLNTTSSSGVRVATAARAEGHDIGGTVFRLGGEPFTRERERILAEAGCRAIIHYAMSETGRIANACATPQARDDVHVLRDKLAVIQRGPRAALHHTSLLAAAPKVLLNAESGDTGVLEDRPCGCPLGALGLTLHLHTIRSYEKLNSEGMTFQGDDLLALVESVLPGAFGGAPADWQLAEEVVDGLTRVVVVASPRLGPLDDHAVVEAVLGALGGGADWKRRQARLWEEGRTVVVRRTEPAVTPAGKVLPLIPLPAGPSRPA